MEQPLRNDMALQIRRSALIVVPGHGTIKIVPRGGRNVGVSAPQSLEIVDLKGRRLSSQPRKALTGRPKRR